MVKTYTSNFISVDDGDVTTHNPQTLVSTDNNITILDADIRWRGVSTSSTSTNYYDYVNKAQGTFGTNTSISETVDFPSVPDGESFDEQVCNLEISRGADGLEDKLHTVEYSYPDLLDPPNTVDARSEEYEDYFTQIEKLTEDEQSSISLDVETEGLENADYTIYAVTSTTETVTNTSKTEDPNVSGDVSADLGTTQLNDGEESNYISLSGLSPNSEDFEHFSSGSNKSEFQFKFDYTFPPDPPTNLSANYVE